MHVLLVQECTTTGCRVWTRGGTATFRTRCVASATYKPPPAPLTVDGNTVTGGKDTWSAYSTCQAGHVAIDPQYA